MATLLNISQLRERWVLHPESVRRLIRKGKLRAISFGGRLRVRLDDVEAFEKAHQVGAGGERL